MAAEIAVISILKSDSTLIELINSANNIHPIERPQASTLPAIVVRGGDIEPSDTKDGVSTLDVEFVQVLMYDSNIQRLINSIEARVRYLLDRITLGTYEEVVVQSSQFQDRDTWSERIPNNEMYTVEHIYKIRVKR